MNREQIIRLMAGTLVLLSLGLGLWVNREWFWLTAFVGANLFQSALTGWCLMDDILRKFFHVRGEAERTCARVAHDPGKSRV